MKKVMYKYFSTLFTITLFLSCSQTQDVPSSNNTDSEWLIPTASVFDGGPGKDGIPSIDNPEFVSISEANYMSDEDLVLAIKSGSEIKAYTHPVLDWHEIINDEIGGVSFALTYCPLTGTGIGWNRLINGDITTFGVSGKLYNTNLMPYDRKTESYWSQMRLDCVVGDLISERAENIMFFETSWKTWKELYPNAPIISTNTGFSRNYGQYPYGDYKTNNDLLIFPVSNENSALPRKERVLAVISDTSTKAYTFDSFKNAAIGVVEDNVDGKNLIIVGSQEHNFIAAFENNDNANFEAVENNFPIVMQDDKGNAYDVFGIVVNGPSQGQQLSQPTSMISYWFALVAFYPDVEIY